VIAYSCDVRRSVFLSPYVGDPLQSASPVQHIGLVVSSPRPDPPVNSRFAPGKLFHHSSRYRNMTRIPRSIAKTDSGYFTSSPLFTVRNILRHYAISDEAIEGLEDTVDSGSFCRRNCTLRLTTLHVALRLQCVLYSLHAPPPVHLP
jgi:hypothetical protein